MDFIEKGTPAFNKVSIAFFAAGFNTFAILYTAQPLMPEFSESFNVTPATSSLSLTLTTLALAVSMLIFGSISEVVGRKQIMVGSMFAASLLCVLTPLSGESFTMLLILRTLQGIVLAGVPSIAMAYINEEIHPRSMPLMMGLYISGNSLGAVFGRVFSGLMVDVFNWQIAFLSIGLISVIATIIFWKLLNPSRNFRAQKLSAGSLLGTLIGHMKNPVLVSLFGVGFLLMGMNIALFSYVTFVLLGDPFNINQSIVSWIFLILLIGTVSSTVNGSLVVRLGQEKVLYLGLSILTTGILILFIQNVLTIILGLSLFVYGFFASHSVVSGLVGRNARKNKAQASSLYLFFYYVGASLLGTLAGLFWVSHHWPGVVFVNLVAAILCFVLVTVAIRLKSRETVSG
ncbi:MAG TPA: MFS transporter [Candidatus Salinicoccus merdavium]|nr:MFS transporter [Candidatus Salinicoccus merdavium]